MINRNNTPELRTTPSTRRSAKALIICMCAFASTAVIGYALFIPDFFSHATSFSGLTAASLVPHSFEETCPIPGSGEFVDSEALSERAIEIDGLTGHNETLASLVYSSVSDRTTADKIIRSLGSAMSMGLSRDVRPDFLLVKHQPYKFIFGPDEKFLRARLDYTVSDVFHVEVKAGEICAWKEDVVLDLKPDALVFNIKNNLIDSVIKAGEYKQLALKITRVFKWDIDFQTESMNGDTCKVLFERRYADDRPSGYNRILLVTYEGTKTGRKTALWFNDKYVNEKGIPLKKEFLRTPLETMRVTSRYGRRFHPILKKWRKHKGIDLGAPVGTPVKAIADGVVTYAGWKGGYGKYVRIAHKHGYESCYGHLKRYHVRKGQRVKQGRKIGEVGSTGLSTGPHLDFQILIGGNNYDPLKVKMIKNVRCAIPRPLMPRFQQVVESRRTLLETCLSNLRAWEGPLAGLR